jgi:arylsulfatase A-like enzyme
MFLWVHYYDAHEPYVRKPGSHWRSASLPAYVEEIRRVDRALGRLVEWLRGASIDAVLVVTADHGEQFGEHGDETHTGSLYEETLRVPVIAWRNRSARNVPTPLPGGSDEMGAYLFALGSGAAPTTLGAAIMSTNGDYDSQIGYVADNWKLIVHRSLGYAELYDLNADPGEKEDLSQAQPGRVRELGERLYRRLYPER